MCLIFHNISKQYIAKMFEKIQQTIKIMAIIGGSDSTKKFKNDGFKFISFVNELKFKICLYYTRDVHS